MNSGFFQYPYHKEVKNKGLWFTLKYLKYNWGGWSIKKQKTLTKTQKNTILNLNFVLQLLIQNTLSMVCHKDSLPNDPTLLDLNTVD